MQDVLTFGRRLVHRKDIAFVEPFDPARTQQRNPEFRTEKDFKARVVLVDPNDTVLSETPIEAFVRDHNFRFLGEDKLAINPLIGFRVENYVAKESFRTEKDYKTRLKWVDQQGQERSRLLVTPPDRVVLLLRGDGALGPDEKTAPPRPQRARAARRRSEGPAQK
jgi:hypothetical protein